MEMVNNADVREEIKELSPATGKVINPIPLAINI